MIASLCKEISLIQGPPGTGKTKIGIDLVRVILDNIDSPIFVLCFTNHALDQFLEHLYNSGIDRIVRLGGGSKSDLIKKFNIKELCRSYKNRKGSMYLVRELIEKKDNLLSELDPFKKILLKMLQVH